MDAFTLLKYLRTSGGNSRGVTTTTTTIFPADARVSAETIVSATAEGPYSFDGEDGPYIDMEFSLTDHDSDVDKEPPENKENLPTTEYEDEVQSDSGEISANENVDDEEEEEEDDGEGELKFAVTSNEFTDQTVAARSHSDELFFKEKLVSVEPSSILFDGSTEENSKLPVFLVKSATKFVVLLRNKLKKSKSSYSGNLEMVEKTEEDDANGTQGGNQGKASGNLLAVKLKVEERPLLSLFTRSDNSSEENGYDEILKINVEDKISNSTDLVLQKYLKMVKPFYIRLSKRYVQRRYSGKLRGGGDSKGSLAATHAAEKVGEGVSAPARGNVKTHLKHGNTNNLQAGLKVVRKHLGKSQSASSVGAAASPGKTTANHRDDSLVQLQDGIEGAILHCKKSFDASRGNQ